jgi:glycosyltransferase involved in cell wall biosynthesis
MSCARPVILGVDGHARSVMEQANAGLFVTPESSAELADAILRLAADPALRESLGRNGRQHVLHYFSRQHTAEVYLDVLQDLLAREQHRVAAAA